jgi:hypothetical protein
LKAAIKREQSQACLSYVEREQAQYEVLTLNINTMTKKETVKFVIQLIASIASAILTALGATSCVGA